MAAHYSSFPAKATIKPTSFRVSVSDSELSDLKQLLQLSKLASPNYENTQTSDNFGVSREWLATAKQHWETTYSWRACEDRINAIPNYTAQITDPDDSKRVFKVHFAALFSKRTDAVPIALFHGWPGSFLEFLPILHILKNKYKPEDLPFHIVVPSLLGYGFSSKPPMDRDWDIHATTRIMHTLLEGLGFGGGYVAQGGDIGSAVVRILAAKYPSCKAAHLNFCPVVDPVRPNEIDESKITPLERKGLERLKEFITTGNAYARMHGTRPSTIGLTLASSPLALLAWIGEKFLEWTDKDPSVDEILDSVTLYWFTESFPTAIYPYRAARTLHTNEDFKIQKPFGFSYFPLELMPTPKVWIEQTGNLVWYNQHESGGHFAAMEKPQVLLDDLSDFISKHWT